MATEKDVVHTTHDAIAALRVMHGKRLENNYKVHVCYVYFKKTFDRTNWVTDNSTWYHVLSLHVSDKVKVRASSLSPRLPFCQILLLSRPPLLS